MTTSARDDVVIVPYEVLFEFFPRVSGWEGSLPPSQFAFLEEDMEAVLELLFTVVLEIVDVMKFKKASTRKRAITVIFALFFTIVSAVPILGAMSFFKERNILGVIISGAIALLFVVTGVIVIVRGHKSNWDKF